MADKYYYKGADINSIIQIGTKTIPTSTFSGFPPYTESSTDATIKSYSKINVDISYCESTEPITTKYNINGYVYKVAAGTTAAADIPIPIPVWANSMKFLIKSTTGAKGTDGSTGPRGDAGGDGNNGAPGHGHDCPMAQKKRPRNGGPGGAGGAGGAGGDGGVGGAGGAGAFVFTSSAIPINTNDSSLNCNIGNANATILSIGNSTRFILNAGQRGNNGQNGFKGKPGQRGNDGGNGGNRCDSPGTGTAGQNGAAGQKGDNGAAGTAGAAANVVIPPIVGGTGNVFNSTATVDVYFFKT
jgi:hypothetical protein